MIPFKDSYYNNKLQEFNDKCSINRDTSLGDFKIEFVMFKTGRIPAYMHIYRGDYYNYPQLKEGDTLWMEITPQEIGGVYETVKRAEGKVGVVGLGLGYFVQEILDKEKVTEVIVYEKSKEVAELYLKNFGTHSKLNIIVGDVFEAEGDSFDFFFVDIYKNKLDKSIVEHYKALNEIFTIKEYSFWGVEHFLLSCDPEEVKRINLPSYWIQMADNLGDRFYQSKYKENFILLDYKSCKQLLEGFKEIFN